MARLRRSLFVPSALCVLLAALTPRRAAAFEHQWHAGLELGYAYLFGAESSQGFGGGLHLAYGVNDSINLLAQIDAAVHPSAKWTVVSGGFGATYALDVLQIVPWAGAEIGPAGLVSFDPKCGGAADPCSELRLNLAIPFGVDYQVSRSFNVGVGGRVQVLLIGGSPLWTLAVNARAEYVWGY
jgi:hypothetical protein